MELQTKKAYIKHMEFISKIPLNSLEKHSEDSKQYRGYSAIGLEESYRSRSLSNNLLHTETDYNGINDDMYEYIKNNLIDDVDNFSKNDTLYKRKDNCIFAGKVFFIPLVNYFNNELDELIIEFYKDKFLDIVGYSETNINLKPQFMTWLINSLKNSQRFSIKLPEASNNNRTIQSSKDEHVTVLPTKSPTTFKQETQESQTQTVKNLVAVLDKPRYILDLENVQKPENTKQDTEITSSLTKHERLILIGSEVEYKKKCLNTLQRITSAYKYNVFNNSGDKELAKIAKGFMQNVMDLSKHHQTLVSGIKTQETDKIFEDIVSNYKKLICCRERDAKGKCVVCPSPHECDVAQDPLFYINKSCEYMDNV